MQFGETDILVYQELCKITRQKFHKLAGKPVSEKRLKNNRCRITKKPAAKKIAAGGNRYLNLRDGLDLAQDALGQILDGYAAAGRLGDKVTGVDLVKGGKV